MKISPLKDYKTPKYAARIAALVAVTAAASGCVQNAGAAMTTEGDTHTSVSDNATALAGDVEAIEETTTQTCEPHTEGTVVTTTEEEIENTQLEGDVAVPDETTAILGAGSIFSAIGAIKDKLFGTGQPELMGDVPNIEDPDTEPEIMGKIPAYTEEPVIEGVIEAPECIDKPEQPEPPVSEGVAPAITDDYPELEGDVPAPDEDLPDDYVFAKYCCDELYYALESSGHNGTLICNDFDAVSGGKSNADSIPSHLTYEYYTDDDKDALVPVDISFVLKDSDTWKNISGASGWTKVNGGYVRSAETDGYAVTEKMHIERKLLLIGVDDYSTELTSDFCNALVSDLAEKGVIA